MDGERRSYRDLLREAMRSGDADAIDRAIKAWLNGYVAEEDSTEPSGAARTGITGTSEPTGPTSSSTAV